MQLPDFRDTRVLVVGDIMLDQYWQGPALRVSPEAPVPVVNVAQQSERAGGAANVAVNVGALGAKVQLDGLIGADDAGRRLRSLMQQHGVSCNFEDTPGFATITKLRVISHNQQLVRLDFEAKQTLADAALLQRFANDVGQADVILLSDYGKGALQDVAAFIALARAQAKPVVVDPKGNDFERYRGATAITPNRSEFELIVGPCQTDADFADKGRALCQRLGLACLLITRGADGMTLIDANGEAHHLAASAREVYDVTGAGDTVAAVFGLAIGHALPFYEAARIANTAAGLVVAKMGTASVSASELQLALRDKAPHAAICGPAELQTVVAGARSAGQRIVMTNGCFDILHAGHVDYLSKARDLGDCLIVAVNDDDSVRRLKGGQRPINCLADRMRVLAALAAVDWVVPFSEDTPEALIAEVLPDVLVKGGDYQVADIAGHAQVLANGGEVLTLPFLEGYSTSALLDKVRASAV